MSVLLYMPMLCSWGFWGGNGVGGVKNLIVCGYQEAMYITLAVVTFICRFL